jgi:glycosyltransferase involved in cell wall biosynthesis
MNIAVSHVLVLDEDPSHPPFSGAENHLFTLIRGQVAAGTDVELILLVCRLGSAIEQKIADLRAAGVTVTVVRTWLTPPSRLTACINIPQLILALRGLLRRRRDRIVHTHLFLTDRLAVLAARAAGHRRVVTSIHNNPPQLGRGFLRRQYQTLRHFTARYIAISDSVRDLLVHGTGLPPEQIHVVRYGLEPPGDERSCAQLRHDYDIPTDRFVLGFVGRLTAQKDLPTLLRALRELPEIHCVIVGFGELETELHARARELGLSNVQFLGHQPNGPELMRAFDVFCLPSVWEGLGLVLLEAMLRGVPIIGSRSGAIPEILGQGEYGLLFDAGDTAQLVDRVCHAAADRVELQEMAERALDYARETFTVQAMTARTQAVYELVCNGEAGA